MKKNLYAQMAEQLDATSWSCFITMSISANLYYNYDHYEDGSIPLSQIIKDNITSYKYGVKNLYYCNTPDGDGKLEKEPVCEGGACAI